MTYDIRKLMTAAAFGAALSGLAVAPASAAERPVDRAVAQAEAQAYPGEAYSQYRRGGYRGRYGSRRRGYGGGAVAAGVIGGLAVGALAGAAIAGSSPGYGYYDGYSYPAAGGPVPVGNVYGHDPAWVQYCASRYRSFDPASGTYLAQDGNRYACQ